MNLRHVPAGSPEGGQFAAKERTMVHEEANRRMAAHVKAMAASLDVLFKPASPAPVMRHPDAFASTTKRPK